MAAMDGEIKLPGVGPVKKKTALFVSAAFTAVIAGIFIVRKRGATANSAAAAAVGDTADSGDSGDSSAAYPGEASGDDSDGYGDQGEAAYGGYGDQGEDAYGGYGDQGEDGYDAAGYPIGSAADLAWQAQQDGTTTISTNAEWLTEAEQYLGNTTSVQAALTKVLGGIAVTDAQKTIFDEAIGIAGNPPQGYPPISITTTSPAPAAAKITVPSVTGESYTAGALKLKTAGLTAKRGAADVGTITYQSPTAGTKVAKGSVVVLGGSGSKKPSKPTTNKK
jgi:hypothetical protein